MSQIDWAAVAANEYAVPEELNPVDAIPELLDMLASPDPIVRDEQAYTILAVWVGAGHFDAVLGELGEQTAKLLSAPDVLTRSFSAVILGEALNRDTILSRQRSQESQLAFRSPQQASALAAWQAWYPHEPDVRSCEDGIGWIHAVAHGADTALALALHPQTDAAQLRLILETLTGRLRTLPMYLSQTEDNRLTLAMLAAFSRPELPVADIRGWLSDYQTLWTSLQPSLIPPGAALAVQTLHSLHTLLHLGATINRAPLRPAHPTETLELVQEALRSVYPYYGSA